MLVTPCFLAFALYMLPAYYVIILLRSHQTLWRDRPVRMTIAFSIALALAANTLTVLYMIHIDKMATVITTRWEVSQLSRQCLLDT